jgi:hypothetical protein
MLQSAQTSTDSFYISKYQNEAFLSLVSKNCPVPAPLSGHPSPSPKARKCLALRFFHLQELKVDRQEWIELLSRDQLQETSSTAGTESDCGSVLPPNHGSLFNPEAEEFNDGPIFTILHKHGSEKDTNTERIEQVDRPCLAITLTWMDLNTARSFGQSVTIPLAFIEENSNDTESMESEKVHMCICLHSLFDIRYLASETADSDASIDPK